MCKLKTYHCSTFGCGGHNHTVIHIVVVLLNASLITDSAVFFLYQDCVRIIISAQLIDEEAGL